MSMRLALLQALSKKNREIDALIRAVKKINESPNSDRNLKKTEKEREFLEKMREAAAQREILRDTMRK